LLCSAELCWLGSALLSAAVSASSALLSAASSTGSALLSSTGSTLLFSALNFEDKRRFDQRVSPHIVGFVPGSRHILCPLVLACLLRFIFMFYLQFIVMLM